MHTFPLMFLLAFASVLPGYSRDSVVVFNEIHYHPAGDDSTREFVELHNQLAVDVDLSNWRLEGDVVYDFPEGTVIAAGGYLVVARDPSALAAATGFVGGLGPYSGFLSNSGSRLVLYNNNRAFRTSSSGDPGVSTDSLEGRRIMDEIAHSDTYPWPVGPDGSGCTLAKRDPATGTAQVEHWAQGRQPNGTPGSANTFPVTPAIAFSEIAAATDPDFQVELHNHGAIGVALGGMVIGSSDPLHDDYVFPVQDLAPGGFITLDAATLGFTPADNTRLFLFAAGGAPLIDAVRTDDRPRARDPDGTGRWLRPDVATFGSPNSFDLEDALVINEIFYHARGEDGEEWLELHNRAATPVDLTGWKLAGGIDFDFPDLTTIAPGGFLVIAKDAAALAGKHPGAAIIGDYSNRLGNDGDFVALQDAVGNPVDEVRYHDSGTWHEAADGGGASLELRDPDADNAVAGAWAPSDESARRSWQTYTYEGVAVDNGIGNDVFHEFLLGLLEAGELLLDDVSVLENSHTEFIQNGSFEGDAPGAPADKWRAIGTHGSHGRTVVVTDPDDPANQCLRVVASGPTEDKHNKVETTFANGEQVEAGQSYRISFRAKFLNGTNLVNTRLYFDYLQRTTAIGVPEVWGTPGFPNTAMIGNAGPTLSGLSHSPVVPGTGEAVTVRIEASDPDGITDLTLFYSVNGGSIRSVAMSGAGNTFTGTLPAQRSGGIVRFHVRARDATNATTFLPPSGAGGGAFYKVQDGFADPSGLRHNFRIVMAESDRQFLFLDTNRMSNDRFPVTVIEDEETVYYDVGLRLKASAWGRYNWNTYGFNIRFQPDRLFRGVHRSISIERSFGNNLQEILAKHLMNRAGGAYWSFYDDVAHIITPTDDDRGVGLLSMSRHTASFWDGLFPEASDSGTLFNHELLYSPTSTVDGDPESLKPGQPWSTVNGHYDLLDRGTDKEEYRWGFQIRSARGRDDYSQLIALNQAMGNLSGAALKEALDPIIDADQWMRTFAMMGLNGTDDVYGRGNEHNLRYYVRPTDGKIIVLQWDLDKTFYVSTGASLPPTDHNVTKLFAIAQYRRLFDGHVNDLIETTFNGAYADPWGAHFSTVTGKSVGRTNYINKRVTTALASLPASVPFQITTNGGTGFAVADSVVDLAGDGWIDVFSIEVNGVAVPVTWTGAESWRITVPVTIGPNLLALSAYNHRGSAVGTDRITVTNTSSIDLAGPDNIVISELHYHPASPRAVEITAGFTDQDWFEFIELTNTSGSYIDLTGTRFADGIDFVFPNGTVLAPGERVVIVSRQDAFEERYGAGTATIVGQYLGNLRNSGEHVRFEAADAAAIADFTYGDALPWPDGADGDGYSLVMAGGNPADPFDWRMSTTIDGNPGTGDTIPFSGPVEDLIPYALSGELAPGLSGESFTVSFGQNLGADDGVIAVEFSTDLVTWTPATPDQLLSLTNNGDGTVTQVWMSPETVSASPKQYARVTVELR